MQVNNNVNFGCGATQKTLRKLPSIARSIGSNNNFKSLIPLSEDLSSITRQFKSQSHLSGRTERQLLEIKNNVLRLIDSASQKISDFKDKSSLQAIGKLGRAYEDMVTNIKLLQA